MQNIGKQLQNVWTAVNSEISGADSNSGANIMFISARTSDSCAEIAREFAKLAALRSVKPVLLLDLDFINNAQYNELGGNKFKWQGPFDLSANSKPFWRLVPRNEKSTELEKKLLVGYRVGNSRLFVSRLRQEKIPEEQSLQIGPNPTYWVNLKKAFDLNVIDAPPLEISGAGIAIVADMDAVVLVIDESIDPADAMELRDIVLNNGGKILGIVVIEASGAKKRSAYG